MKLAARIQSVRVEPVSFPLRRPFVTAAGRKDQTENVRVTLQLSDGTRGLAEASSSIAMPGESQAHMMQVLREMTPELRGRPIDDYRDLAARCWRLSPLHPTAAAAMECAILDAFARTRGQSLAAFFGGRQEAVETDLTLSVDTPERQAAAARAAARQGFRRLKVKLAGRAEADFERLQAVSQAAPKAQLVADGNQGFSLAQGLRLAQRLERAGPPLFFFEQPFGRHDLRSMRLFRQRCGIPLFADESVRSAADAVRLFEAGAADGVNLKVAKSGLLQALDIIQMTRRAGKRLAIGCMEESKTGLAASVHLACGTGAFEWIDLDSVFLLEGRPPRGGFRIDGPRLSVRGIGPGIGL